MIRRKDGSLRADYTNTHKQLQNQYQKVIDRIKVNEEDLSVLSDSLDSTDSDWLRIIVSEQKTLYRDLEYLEDRIADISNYQG